LWSFLATGKILIKETKTAEFGKVGMSSKYLWVKKAEKLGYFVFLRKIIFFSRLFLQAYQNFFSFHCFTQISKTFVIIA
jgi:hypothetical protein